MRRWIAVLLLSVVGVLAAEAAEYHFDGELGPGDPQDAEFSAAGAYYDLFQFEAEAGNEIMFAVRGMTERPEVQMFDGNMVRIDATTSVYGNDIDYKWKAPEAGSYTFLLSTRYRAETPYQLTISDLPPGTVQDYGY